jgi:hypothetical protein
MEINPVSSSAMIPPTQQTTQQGTHPNPQEEPLKRVTTYKTVSPNEIAQMVYCYNSQGQLVLSQKSTLNLLV